MTEMSVLSTVSFVLSKIDLFLQIDCLSEAQKYHIKSFYLNPISKSRSSQ